MMRSRSPLAEQDIQHLLRELTTYRRHLLKLVACAAIFEVCRTGPLRLVYQGQDEADKPNAGMIRYVASCFAWSMIAFESQVCAIFGIALPISTQASLRYPPRLVYLATGGAHILAVVSGCLGVKYLLDLVLSMIDIFWKASNLYYQLDWMRTLGLGGRARLQIVLLINVALLLSLSPHIGQCLELAQLTHTSSLDYYLFVVPTLVCAGLDSVIRCGKFWLHHRHGHCITK